MSEKPNIGFIGLGTMGLPMASRLLQAGHPLYVIDKKMDLCEELVEMGATAASSIQEIAEKCQIMILCLPDTPDVVEVVKGSGGLLDATSEGNIIIDMSTVSPVTTRELAEFAATRGVRMLDAPVSGGNVGAQSGTLAIMVGGDESTVSEALPIFEILGSTITHVGSNGAGQTAKMCNQVVYTGTLLAVCEALILATKAGVDPAKVVNAIKGGAARCWVLDVQAETIMNRKFDPDFKSSLQFKDLNIVQDAANAFRVVMPLSSVIHELYKSMLTKGLGDIDTSGVVKVLEALSETEVGSGKRR